MWCRLGQREKIWRYEEDTKYIQRPPEEKESKTGDKDGRTDGTIAPQLSELGGTSAV